VLGHFIVQLFRCSGRAIDGSAINCVACELYGGRQRDQGQVGSCSLEEPEPPFPWGRHMPQPHHAPRPSSVSFQPNPLRDRLPFQVRLICCAYVCRYSFSNKRTIINRCHNSKLRMVPLGGDFGLLDHSPLAYYHPAAVLPNGDVPRTE